MEKEKQILLKELQKLRNEIKTIGNVGVDKLSDKLETNKEMKNLVMEVDKLKVMFDKLYSKGEIEKAVIQNQKNNKVAYICKNVPKVFDPKKTMTVRKGEKWRYYILNAWLESTLKMKGQWTIKNLGHKVMHREVEFFKIEYKNYILNNKSTWDKENIWIWEDVLAIKSEDPKRKLIDYGTHQKKHGKRVVFHDDCLCINGEKYVWDDRMKRVIIYKEEKKENETNLETEANEEEKKENETNLEIEANKEEKKENETNLETEAND